MTQVGDDPWIWREERDGRSRERAPLGWRMTCLALAALASGAWFVVVFQFWTVVSTDRVLSTVPTNDSKAVLSGHLVHLYRFADVAEVVNPAILTLMVVLPVLYVVWMRSSIDVIRFSGRDDVKPIMRHWSMTVWAACAIVAATIEFWVHPPRALGNDMETVTGQLRLMELAYALRIVAVGFIIVGVVRVSQRIRRVVAEEARRPAA